MVGLYGVGDDGLNKTWRVHACDECVTQKQRRRVARGRCARERIWRDLTRARNERGPAFRKKAHGTGH
jgi:hypothetical protein